MVTGKILLACAAVYALILVYECLRLGFTKQRAVESAILAMVLVFQLSEWNFDPPQAFGAAEDFGLVAIMFLGVLAGMAARYFFYLRGEFQWRNFLKPICVSPIVLFPLLNIFPFGTELKPIQWLSFGILAFQNGFFWRTIFEQRKPTESATDS